MVIISVFPELCSEEKQKIGNPAFIFHLLACAQLYLVGHSLTAIQEQILIG
jgi:hypothetical protein